MSDPTPWLDTDTGIRYAHLDDAPPGTFIYSPRTDSAHRQDQS